MVNKYWMVSWGEILSICDNEAHKNAVCVIWECVTASASIFFYKELEIAQNYRIDIDTFKISNSKVQATATVFHWDSVIASAVFLFITRK